MWNWVNKKTNIKAALKAYKSRLPDCRGMHSMCAGVTGGARREERGKSQNPNQGYLAGQIQAFNASSF
jgi:hypothetical protein